MMKKIFFAIFLFLFLTIGGCQVKIVRKADKKPVRTHYVTQIREWNYIQKEIGDELRRGFIKWEDIKIKDIDRDNDIDIVVNYPYFIAVYINDIWR